MPTSPRVFGCKAFLFFGTLLSLPLVLPQTPPRVLPPDSRQRLDAVVVELTPRGFSPSRISQKSVKFYFVVRNLTQRPQLTPISIETRAPALGPCR